MNADALRDVVFDQVAVEFPGELYRRQLDSRLKDQATPEEILRALNYLHDQGRISWRRAGNEFGYRLTAAGWAELYAGNDVLTHMAGSIVDVLYLEYPHETAESSLLGALLEKLGMDGLDSADFDRAIGYLVLAGYVYENATRVGDRAIRGFKLTPAGVDLADGKRDDPGVLLG